MRKGPLADCAEPRDSDAQRGVLQWTTLVSVWWRRVKGGALRLPYYVGHAFRVGDSPWSMADWFSECDGCYHIGSASDPRIPFGKCTKSQADNACAAHAPVAADWKLPPGFSRMWLLGEVPQLQPTRDDAGRIISVSPNFIPPLNGVLRGTYGRYCDGRWVEDPFWNCDHGGDFLRILIALGHSYTDALDKPWDECNGATAFQPMGFQCPCARASETQRVDTLRYADKKAKQSKSAVYVDRQDYLIRDGVGALVAHLGTKSWEEESEEWLIEQQRAEVEPRRLHPSGRQMRFIEQVYEEMRFIDLPWT